MLLQDRLISDSPVRVSILPIVFFDLVVAIKTANLRNGVDDDEHPTICHQGDGQGRVVPRRVSSLFIPIHVHDDPGHPDAHRDQAYHQNETTFLFPLCIFAPHDGQTCHDRSQDENHHVDQRHDKVLVGNVTRCCSGSDWFSRGIDRKQRVANDCDDEPLGVDDNLHQPHPQRSQPEHPAPGPSIPPGQDVQPDTLHQEAGETPTKQHPKEKSSRGTGGEVLPHNESECQAEESSSAEQKAGLKSQRVFMVGAFDEGHAGQKRNEEHKGKDDASCCYGFYHNAPDSTEAAQVVVEGVQVEAAALRGHISSHGAKNTLWMELYLFREKDREWLRRIWSGMILTQGSQYVIRDDSFETLWSPPNQSNISPIRVKTHFRHTILECLIWKYAIRKICHW